MSSGNKSEPEWWDQATFRKNGSVLCMGSVCLLAFICIVIDLVDYGGLTFILAGIWSWYKFRSPTTSAPMLMTLFLVFLFGPMTALMLLFCLRTIITDAPLSIFLVLWCVFFAVSIYRAYQLVCRNHWPVWSRLYLKRNALILGREPPAKWFSVSVILAGAICATAYLLDLKEFAHLVAGGSGLTAIFLFAYVPMASWIAVIWMVFRHQRTTGRRVYLVGPE